MHLKLRVGVGETLTIEVQPTDTFQDLSDRLYNVGGVKVDLSQLKSDNRPFDMSTNVMQYFQQPKSKGETTTHNNNERNGKLKRYCRLCAESITGKTNFLFDGTKPHFPPSPPPEDYSFNLFEKVNCALPVWVNVRDHLPKQICNSCSKSINQRFNFMKRVIVAQKTLQEVLNLDSSAKPATNFRENSCCPLCNVGQFKHVDGMCNFINGQHNEKISRKEVTISVPKGPSTSRNDNTYLPRIKAEPLDPDFIDDINTLTDYWISHDEIPNVGRRKKKSKHEDDHDWTIDEEYVPVSRRGRPRGTKNKPKVPIPIVEKSCALCGWLGADIDMYAHAINQHCQPDMGYFPCPLCKTNHANEIILEGHIDKHNARKTK